MQRFLLALSVFAVSASAAEFTLNGHTFTVPDGFTVELVAGPPLVDRPIVADFDERGRLYVADSSGSNDKVEKQLAEKPHRIVRLEDSDGDGAFDRRTIFADQMMFPEGTMWLDGSLYVAAPPSIWKLTDTNDDGIADERVEWFKGKTLTGCANDLHGPYRGPDGWVYWCKGAFAEQTYEREGKPPLVTKAAHIFRARPDGSGIESVMTGGMDNPVGLAFTRTGDLIFSCTFFQHPAGGQRDGLIHALYGGVYGKPHAVLDGHARTGDLLPPMTHLGSAAPAGMVRYDSGAFGAEYRDNLFVSCFNLRKVTRHILEPSGATYRTRDEDFLVAQDGDFHPTDVREAVDGSLLILDTGGWYKLCCPTSQLAKPDVLGAIYRVRRKVMEPLASHPSLWSHVRAGAREPVREALGSSDESEQLIALHAVSLWRDVVALEKTGSLLASSSAHVRRAAATALGRIGDSAATPALLFAADPENDRALEHAITYALFELGDRERLRAGLISPVANKAAFIALAQLGGEGLQREDVQPWLFGEDAAVRALAAFVVRARPEWTEAIAKELLERAPDSAVGALELEPRADLLASLASAPAVRRAIVADLEVDNPLLQERRLVLKAIARAQLKEMPPEWAEPLLKLVSHRETLGDPGAGERLAQERELVLGAFAAMPPAKAMQGRFSAALLDVARDSRVPSDVRLRVLAAVPAAARNLDDELFAFLGKQLAVAAPLTTRTAAADLFAKSPLTVPQRLALARLLATATASELSRLLTAFEKVDDEATGRAVLTSLRENPARASLSAGLVKSRLTKFPPALQGEFEALLTSLGGDPAQQRAHLDGLASSLKEGDVRRGQAVFNSAKAACATCHAIGYLGGQFGPDLTKIGTVRNERDLLEAIVFPSASFVRSYEPAMVSLKSGETVMGLLREENATSMRLATAPGQETTLARADIAEHTPGAVSLMPPGMDQLLTRQELADLIAFLKATKW